MGKESHYSSKKDRVFVRGIQGQYSLKDELKRLRSMPRVIKGRDLHVQRRPAVVQQALRRAGRRPDADAARAPRGVRAGWADAEARPRQRGRVLHPRRHRLRGPRRRALRLEGGRHRDRAHELRAPALQRRPGQARARAGDEAQAAAHVHEHAVPADGDPAADGGRDARRARATCRATSKQTSTTRNSHGLERVEGVEAWPAQPEAVPGQARGCGGGAGAQQQAQEGPAPGGHALGALAAGAAEAPVERGR